MKCNKCGAQLAPETEVCPYCGGNIKDGKMQKCAIICVISAVILLTVCVAVGLGLSMKSEKTTTEKNEIADVDENIGDDIEDDMIFDDEDEDESDTETKTTVKETTSTTTTTTTTTANKNDDKAGAIAKAEEYALIIWDFDEEFKCLTDAEVEYLRKKRGASSREELVEMYNDGGGSIVEHNELKSAECFDLSSTERDKLTSEITNHHKKYYGEKLNITNVEKVKVTYVSYYWYDDPPPDKTEYVVTTFKSNGKWYVYDGAT